MTNRRGWGGGGGGGGEIIHTQSIHRVHDSSQWQGNLSLFSPQYEYQQYSHHNIPNKQRITDTVSERLRKAFVHIHPHVSVYWGQEYFFVLN